MLRKFSAKLCRWLDLLILDTEGDLWGALLADVDELRLTALVDRGSRGAFPSAEPLEVDREDSMGNGSRTAVNSNLYPNVSVFKTRRTAGGLLVAPRLGEFARLHVVGEAVLIG